MNSAFMPEDVTLLLEDITGKIQPKPTSERERLIQSGVHYSEMLPLEQRPSEQYLREYYHALETFANQTAEALAIVCEKVYAAKGSKIVLASLARAGIPIAILMKRYLKNKYKILPSHYAISIIRGKGIDEKALEYIMCRHSHKNIVFVDGWTGKGAILSELLKAIEGKFDVKDKRKLLAVLADPANVTDFFGTRDDFPIASSCLNSTVCGLISRTVLLPNSDGTKFHGACFYKELKQEDRTYEFIDEIEKRISYDMVISFEKQSQNTDVYGFEEVKLIAEHFGVRDVSFVKPGIGETTRVLLRRVPDKVLIAENTDEKYISHILKLAEEKKVPIVFYPLKSYKACGIIKKLSADI